MKRGSDPASINFKRKTKKFLTAITIAAVLLICAFASACKRQHSPRVSAERVHQITQQFGKAAAGAGPHTEIRIRKGRRSDGAGIDELRIRVRGDAEAANRIRQSLNDVATRNRLMVDKETQRGSVSVITLRSAGVLTHRIEIETLSSPEIASADRDTTNSARLAILLDDLGNDRQAAEQIFALGVPLTLSVLPFHEHSREIAEEARNHGCEVMLHLPMQSVVNETPELEELRPGLSQQQVDEMVNRMLEAVPEADGINNHQGSQATSNTALMNELMPVLRDAGMFYVDSRTTAATVAYDVAKQNGVKTAYRNVPFLDDVRQKEAIKGQLRIAIHGAKQKGEAIAIGHPHSETLQALKETLPEVKKAGVRLVFVSELVR